MSKPKTALNSDELLASTLHFWWVAFLRSSKDFWWICQQQGKCLDQRLVKIWEDFGDLYSYDSFSQWWLHKGTKLFDSPQIEMELIKALSSGLELLLKTDLKKSRPGMICLAIPAHLDAAAVSAAVIKLFETAHIRGQHYDMDAKYQVIKGGNEKNYNSIKPAYLTNALRVCIDHSQEGDQINNWGNYQMSKFLELCPQHHPEPGDSIVRAKNKQRSMRTKNSQAYEMSTRLIANVEIGLFPSTKKVATRDRWTQTQQAELDSAVSNGRWHRANWFEQEHAFMRPSQIAQHTLEFSENQRALSLLRELRDASHVNLGQKLKAQAKTH